MLNRFHTAEGGYGFTNFVASDVGLPNSFEPSWLINPASAPGISFTETETGILFSTLELEDNPQRYLNRFDISTGSYERIAAFRVNNKDWARYFSAADYGAVFGRHFIDTRTAQNKVIDFADIFLKEGLSPTPAAFRLGKTYICTNFGNPNESGSDHFIYNVNTGDHDVINLPIYVAKHLPDSDYFYGGHRRDGKCFLLCCDIEGNILWKTSATKPWYQYTGDKIVSVHETEALAYSRDTGEHLYTIDCFEGLNLRNCRYVVSSDQLAIENNRSLHVFSWQQNKKVYSIEKRNIRCATGAGDIYFCVRGGSKKLARSDEDYTITAYDRYSGEVLWQYDDECRIWDNLSVIGGHLVAECYAIGGGIAAWKLGEPYISPHRPS